MNGSILTSSGNVGRNQYIRVFNGNNEEYVQTVPFTQSVTVNQLVKNVIGCEDKNVFVTKKGSSVVFDGEITTSTDVISMSK